MKKFYLTTPLYYANARPHVGSAYSTIVCDTIARYKRLCGLDVAFLTGTDEHGQKLERAAVELGLTPQQLVDSNSRLFRELWERLDISYTHFIRTTQKDHTRSVQRIFQRAYDAGYITKGQYQGRYCVHDELYVSDSLQPADCPTCGRPAELMTEENYFFKLSAFQDRLLQHYEKNPEFIRPDFRRNEVISFVKSGLRNISISRKTLKWGIPLPGIEGQVFYVWYDALTGYLTGIGFAEGEEGSEDFRKYWPADVHMIGKEIVRFHGVYWPAFLMAASLPLPKTVFAHGWLLFEQEKMSKSKGNVVYCEPILEVLGADALRYYLLRDIPFGQDSSFSYEGLIQRFNSDLANDLGNLASRTITMLNMYFGGVVPSPSDAVGGDSERSVLVASLSVLDSVPNHFSRYDFSRGLQDIWHLIGTVNQYLTDTQPWAIAEDPSQRNRLATVLYRAAEALRIIAVLAYPVLPVSMQKLWEQLGQPSRVEDVRLEEPHWEKMRTGTRVGQPEIIFPRVEKEATLTKLRELEEKEPGVVPAQKEVRTTVEPQAEPKISIEDFAKVDMRVGEIVAAEPVPGTQKLTKLRVDIGTEVRQVVAGIAEYYQPEQLIGMKVVLVVNLQPRKLRGIESNGMIVAATVGEEERPVLVTFREDVPKGARLK